MTRSKYLILPIFSALALTAWPAQAVCPVCIVAVGVGLGLSEYLGIDNTIAGLWIGGLLVALSIWTITWLDKKRWLTSWTKIRNILVFLIYYGSVIWPLASQDFISQAFPRLWGIDKLLLGIIVGSLLFVGASAWYDYLKKNNGGRAYFPYQKIVMPVGLLIIFSLIFYFITR